MPLLASESLALGANGRLYFASIRSVVLYGMRLGELKREICDLTREE